jgi:hypothetical protein
MFVDCQMLKYAFAISTAEILGHYQSDWITAHERAGSGEGGCVDTPVLGVSEDASEMTYVASVHASYAHVQVTKQWLI